MEVVAAIVVPVVAGIALWLVRSGLAAAWRERHKLKLPFVRRSPLIGWRARQAKALTMFGGWLYILHVHIINRSAEPVSLRPYIVIRLETPNGPSRMTLSTFDMAQHEQDPWHRVNFADGGLALKVEVLDQTVVWLTKEIGEVLAEDQDQYLKRPIRLQAKDETRGRLAFFFWAGGLPRTGAGFADKKKPGVLVSDRVPPILEFVLDDALNDDLWKNPDFGFFEPAFEEVRAIWPPRL